MSELYQIYYNDIQLPSLYPFSIPYKNEKLTIFFENSVMADIVMKSKANTVGVCSWKLRKKRIYNILRPRELTQEVLETDYDVLCFTGNSKNHKMLAAAENWHPGFKKTMEVILDMIGQKMPGEVKSPIYQNSFMAKLGIYQDYVKNWLAPVMEGTLNDPMVYKLMTVDSHYSELAKKDSVSPEYLQEKIGMPFYPLAPFILERLFSIYCHNNKIKVTQL